MAVVITFCVVFVVVDIVACAPWPSENWLSQSLIDRCERIAVDLITAAVYISAITDFYILFIPPPITDAAPLRKEEDRARPYLSYGLIVRLRTWPRQH